MITHMLYQIADALGLTAYAENKNMLARVGVDYTRDVHAKFVTHIVDHYDEKPKTFPDLLQDVDDALYAIQMAEDASLQKQNAQKKLESRCSRLRAYADVLNDITKADLFLDIRPHKEKGVTHMERVFENRKQSFLRITR
jgi:hypothetical protein